jgi:hyaluronoglucosaminidase
VIEGFYGNAWSHEDRLWVLERLGSWDLNLYVYAPKNDPLHRERWRDPYPPRHVREFGALVRRGEAHGVGVGFAISPGLSIRYSSREDRAVLAEKMVAFRDLGSRFLSLALDDVPTRLVHEEDRRAFGSLAEAHVLLAHDLLERLGPEVTLWLVPTDYVGAEPTPYLEHLGEKLDPSVEVAWTGRTIVSPTILAEEAARRSATLRRPLLIWDNVPVSDGPMRSMLHLGPYGGRDPGIAEHASGVLLNPMERAHASGIGIRTAASFLRSPEDYDAEREWEEALDELGDGDPTSLRTFAEAHRFHPIWPEDRDRDLEQGLLSLRQQFGPGEDISKRIEELQRLVEERRQCGPRLRERLRDQRLVQEIEPWLESHERETRRIAAALEALEGILTGPTASQRCAALMVLEGRLTADATPVAQSYGPRRVLYPQIASMGDDTMMLGPDPALFRNRCLADAFILFAEEVALSRLKG